MRRSILSCVAAATIAFSAPAVGKTVPISTQWYPQQTAIPGYTTATVLQPFSTPVAANGTAYQPQTVAGVYSEEVKIQGQNKRVTLFNTTSQPLAGMDGQYIGIINGANYIINFLNGGVQFFSFVFNNLGSDDKLTLTFADGTTKMIVGQDILNGGSIIGVQNNQIPTSPNDWGRVAYDMLGGPNLVSADFHSGADAWYIDSIAWALPEPGTWAMMIFGFGIAGSQLRKRRRMSGAVVTA